MPLKRNVFWVKPSKDCSMGCACPKHNDSEIEVTASRTAQETRLVCYSCAPHFNYLYTHEPKSGKCLNCGKPVHGDREVTTQDYCTKCAITWTKLKTYPKTHCPSCGMKLSSNEGEVK